MMNVDDNYYIELNYKEKQEKKLFFGAYSYYLIDEWLKKLTKARNFSEWLD